MQSQKYRISVFLLCFSPLVNKFNYISNYKVFFQYITKFSGPQGRKAEWNNTGIGIKHNEFLLPGFAHDLGKPYSLCKHIRL